MSSNDFNRNDDDASSETKSLKSTSLAFWRWNIEKFANSILPAEVKIFINAIFPAENIEINFFLLNSETKWLDEDLKDWSDIYSLGLNPTEVKLFSFNTSNGGRISITLDPSLASRGEIQISATTTRDVILATKDHPSLAPTLTFLFRKTPEISIAKKEAGYCGDLTASPPEECDTSIGCSSECKCLTPMFVPLNGVCIPSPITRVVHFGFNSGPIVWPTEGVSKKAGVYFIARGGGTQLHSIYLSRWRKRE